MPDYGNPYIQFDFAELEERTKHERWWVYSRAAQDVIDHVFPGALEQRQVYAVSGDTPFSMDDLIDLLERGGWYEPETVENLWDLATYEDFLSEYYMVVGRVDFHTDLLDWALGHIHRDPGSLLVLSQEDFLQLWLFGRYEPYTRGDPRIDDHPALRYLVENSGPRWPWPSTEPQPSFGSEVDANGWLRVHPLKGRFGYTVSSYEDLTDAERRRRLDRALTTPDNPLSLRDVVNHIAWQVRWKKKQNNRQFARAIARWESDLVYLKEKYYRRGFTWPETE